MADKVFGEVDWNSGDVGSKSGGANDFMRLEQGDNTVRIMGNPVQAYVHWLDLPGGKKKKIVSPISDPELVAKLEEAGFARKPTWYLKVLDRKDETFKLLEIGSQIYSGVRALYENRKWGNVTKYDITITKGPKGTNPLYLVSPDPAEALDPSFKEKYVQFTERVQLDKIIKPADPKAVRELLGWPEQGQRRTVTTATKNDDFEADFGDMS